MKSKEFYDFEYLKKNAWVQANELKARGVKEFDGIKMISSDFFENHPNLSIPLYLNIVKVYFNFINGVIPYERGVEKIKVLENDYLNCISNYPDTDNNDLDEDFDEDFQDSFKFISKLNDELRKHDSKPGEYTFECPVCNGVVNVKKFNNGVIGNCSKCGMSLIR
ncbi:hypothetical protein BFS06_11590 [Clostridium perfringens]|uniref:hypothetical protein n=1 Tax=Clostridium perfringens TaxID=1502 RepID=UPI00103E2CFB|nr:hypothetical protein [Clostridium perfringens]TBX14856.1 hypothetical protein BFS06_11590 [Clostridium perfringens]